MNLPSNNKGYITLFSTLIVGAVGVSIATTLLLQGTVLSKTVFATQQSMQAQALVDACVEEALQQIASNNSYTGTSGLTEGEGSCTYTVTNTGGSTRRIESVGTVDPTVRRAVVLVSELSPQVTINSWQEVASF